jgi:hypothetical protein
MAGKQTRTVTYDTYKISIGHYPLLHAERDEQGNIRILVFPKLLTIENVMEFNEWVQSPPLPPEPAIGAGWVGKWNPKVKTFTHVRTGKVFELKEEET